MCKACDKVEHEFLKRMLLKLGFHISFINFIMTCVTTVLYSLILNGEQFGFFLDHKGAFVKATLYHPIAFFFVQRYLVISFIRQSFRTNSKELTWLDMLLECHTYSCKWYVIYCQATTNDIQYAKEILRTYALTSRQETNHLKSTMIFSHNIPAHIRSSGT